MLVRVVIVPVAKGLPFIPETLLHRICVLVVDGGGDGAVAGDSGDGNLDGGMCGSGSAVVGWV